ncbi:MAG: nuclear transport factor 2 family protein [Rhizobiales bacterium]|nr:nuclear transport factor 2 family protein [Hyphomicrobiales bacterium]OJU30078.1 MAG: hypothetical protein BGN94_02100 [Rhizobiales bacterium 68-8]
MEDLYALGAKCFDRICAYHYDIDRGAATKGIVHFTDDAVFEAQGKRYEGRDGVMSFLTNREAQTDRHTVHVITGPRFSRGDDGSLLVGTIILISVRDAEGQYTISKAVDTVHRFVETRDGWLIASRLSKPLH